MVQGDVVKHVELQELLDDLNNVPLDPSAYAFGPMQLCRHYDALRWSMENDWQRRTFIILWVTYASFYLGRVNFSAAIPSLMNENGWTRANLGMVGTCFFWSYAIGQFINGQMGDRLGARLYVTIGLVISAIMNISFGFSDTILQMSFIWAINGYFQSLGWPLMVKTLANWFPVVLRGKISGLLGTSYIIGGAISVSVAGFTIKHYGWRFGFILPGLLLFVFSVNWAVRARNTPLTAIRSEESRYIETFTADLLEAKTDYPGLRYTLSQTVGNWNVWLMGFGLFFVNIVRYGFLMWAPTYLFETQAAAIDKAAYSSAILPIAGSIGAISAGWVSDKIFQSRRAPVACIYMVLAGILAWVYRFVIPTGYWEVSLAVLSCIGFVLYGAHVMIVAAAPMDYGTKKAAASATGFIDGWGYIGAGLECFGTGYLVDRWGWNAGFAFWIFSAFIAAAIMVIQWRYVPENMENGYSKEVKCEYSCI
jgi:sugar phosphate permease